MDIQAEKIELARLILSTNDRALINQIKSLFKSRDENWFDDLPAPVKQDIQESIGQADRGEFVAYDEVKKAVARNINNDNKKEKRLPCS